MKTKEYLSKLENDLLHADKIKAEITLEWAKGFPSEPGVYILLGRTATSYTWAKQGT